FPSPLLPPPPSSPPFPYTTLFRSWRFSSRVVNQKTDPFPSALSTPIRPPISSTIRCEIASPSPVPPNFLVVEASTCENDLKSRPDRKSTRLNSSHVKISYAVFCLK